MVVEGDWHLRPSDGVNRVFEDQVNFTIIQLELAPA
jgi:hypothetical protein